MGALFNGYCYGATADAAAAFYSAQAIAQTAGATSYRNYYKWDGAAWAHIGESIASNGAITQLWSVTAVQAGFPSCDATESFFDGITLGWGVATAMVIAWGWLHLRRQIR